MWLVKEDHEDIHRGQKQRSEHTPGSSQGCSNAQIAILEKFDLFFFKPGFNVPDGDIKISGGPFGKLVQYHLQLFGKLGHSFYQQVGLGYDQEEDNANDHQGKGQDSRNRQTSVDFLPFQVIDDRADQHGQDGGIDEGQEDRLSDGQHADQDIESDQEKWPLYIKRNSAICIHAEI